MSHLLTSSRFQTLIIATTLVAALVLSFVLLSSGAYAQTNSDNDMFGVNQVNIGLQGDKTPTEIAVGIIRIAMTFLGLVATFIMLYGGFKWMTAGGNEEKVGEAKKLIAAGIIGLIIILASFSIVTFVLNRVSDVVGTNG